ncbi:MAG: efflux RND transporter periplasmic adaptor subunit [Zunongwangia sp.]|jgi:Cu(I)/Ag(I) efflux system membrane fusion protein|uniref:Metal transport-related, exported protein n=4 Tax=Flavobacteriaceae TaxID=49546 RepID=D5BB00_ZUNPS|nr:MULTISPECIES: efflux RND transporter periplasmic adaptor subunit [Flavobacteriaceae]MAC65058.1 efflux RND transporter periplasmic adaptor subunit [Flavobacteriaceae bacterium]MAO37042.1 efflux RND transporter periplasmic adaptor subunit [Zunongwangia sp.]MAZ27652.1 efflux RND transporter periplasmic adaptor subunit [Cytophagaceae bacterium]HEA28893.1 efflux RND transporter periplasmic adaptor subunit [Leeuwenhoekiella sp.]ADF54540.1 putative metal transport-related, exported protein [Zunong|tara:strand:- start:16821 stop:18605 length:1785 start_codon:yes stop_codon:yes gene_type:complete
MKKYIIYTAILAIGLVLGYVFFGPSAEGSVNSKKVTDLSEDVNHSEEHQMWTCSMHPQIMQPEPGDCPICGMDLIPAETGAEGLAMNEIKMSDNAMALANIQTTIVGNISGTDDNKITLSGKIMANEEANAVQASYFEGRIEKLNVNFTGEEVRKGQLLATIYAPTLVAAQQELLTASDLKESQPGLYKAVRNKLKLWKLSESQIDQIESSGKVRENFPIYATVSGTVSQKMAEEGDYVKQGQPIVKVSDLGTVWAMFDAYERQISQLKEGQKVTITSNAYPNKEFEASVSFIDPTLNTKSRTVSVRATLNNKENLLKPGMFVTAKVAMTKGNTMEIAISIPATAVMWTGERSLVYVKTNPNEPVFEMQEVTLGTKNGENYTIIEGLSNGDEVVTNGTFTVDAAAQLQGKKSMMNASGGKTMTGHEGHLGMENLNNTVDAAKRMDVASKFQEQLKTVFDDYIMLKTALTNDQSEKAKTAAQTLQKSLTQVDLALLKDKNANNHWAQLEKELKASSNEIAQTSDIKTQRNHFISLSAHLINAMKAFGINQEIYIDFCPMANNNEGAYWLSTEKEIQNPYYGQAMLNCGEVTETVQ